jgi:CRP-like cAMP-binding protein
MPADDTGKTVELLVALKAVPPFAALPAEDLALLVERATPRDFAPGEVIIARGSTVEAMHVVVEGTLIEERAGRPWAVREPYDIVGGVDALAGASTELEVHAKGPARTLEMQREALLEVCYDRFEVLNAIVTGVAGMAIATRLRLGAAAGFGAPAAPGGERPPARLDLAERVAFMRSMPVLHDVAMLTLAEVAARSERVTFGQRETLWRMGDRADHVLVVVSGVIDCTAGDGLRFAFGPREAAGVLDALAEVPRWYDATARTRVIALRTRIADVLDVLEDDPATAVAGLTHLARATSNLVSAVAA